MSTAAARVQPGSEALQGCELFVMQLPFERVEPAASLVATWDAEPGWSFGPFDEARFGFRTARLTVLRLPLPFDDAYAQVRLILSVERQGATRFWAFTQDLEETDFEYQGPWYVMHTPGRRPDRMLATAATPDPAMPVFALKYEVSWRGRGINDTTQQLVIDATKSPPVIAVRLEERRIDGYSISVPVRPDARCEWNASRRDFLCAEKFFGSVRYRWMSDGRCVPDRCVRTPSHCGTDKRVLARPLTYF